MSGTQAVRIVGGIVPPSLLDRVQAGEVPAASLTPASYHLAGSETLRDAAARAWAYLRGAWTAYRAEDAPTIGQTRDKWLLPLVRELGYGNVPALSRGLTVQDTDYSISHMRDHVPMHLLGPGVFLDRRNRGVAGAARAPQAMLQEYLNRSEAHLWALLSNGTALRLLRDSTALAGSAYIEFDLEAIFDGELYPDFLLLFRLAHSSRLEKRGGEESGPADCWLEAWRTEAVDTGTRALDRLRGGVEQALTALGEGFLHHPDNRWLVEALRRGDLTDRDYLRALLRLVYRLLFCFVAEDRNALLTPDADPQTTRRYTQYYSTARLRRMARVRAGGPHPDLWQAQRLILQALGGDGLPALGVPALGGLFDPDPRAQAVEGQPGPDLLLSAELSNHALLTAIRALGWVRVDRGRIQPVDYRNLGAEELGSVYESLLELVPRVDLEANAFRLDTTAGNDRKTTGSYYTPPALIAALLDTALDPLLDDAVKNADTPDHAEQRLLALTICDPACGSGGFLVAAARRIARRLAQVRSGEDEPTPETVQHALRDVVGRCIYGVDLNDLAAELAKVSLWLEALEPGKPLGFLDARIRVGNSLIGATPALLADGVPDAAFKEIEGDDKKYAAAIRKQNKQERAGARTLFDLDHSVSIAALPEERRGFLTPVDDVDGVREQAQKWQQYQNSDALRRARLHADAWTAAFVWPLTPGALQPVTDDVLLRIHDDPDTPALRDTVGQVQRLAHEYRFFHWHLEFPEVFDDPSSSDTGPDGWTGGFSALLGNPPWERVKLQEQEFFAARSPHIAAAPNAAARRKLIQALATDDPTLYRAFLDERRRAEGVSHILRMSGRYPLNGRGDVNTYAVFAELFRNLTGPHGQSGVIVPTGIATDATTQHFFKDLVASQTLYALYGFDHRTKYFGRVQMQFCLLSIVGRRIVAGASRFAFGLLEVEQMAETRFSLSPHEITLLNPNTGTCPVFRTRRDAEITLGIYRRVPVLINEAKVAAGDPDGNPWGVSFMRMFDMSNDSHLFHTREQLEADGWTLVGNVFHRGNDTMLPLYEGKMMHHFDHRWATFTADGSRDLSELEKRSATVVGLPRYWVEAKETVRRIRSSWRTGPQLGYRWVARNSDERTLIFTTIPFAPAGNSMPITQPMSGEVLCAMMNAFVVDYCARQKLAGANMTYGIVGQLPVLAPAALGGSNRWIDDSLGPWARSRVLELTYTAWDMEPFAEDTGDVDNAGRVNPPFVWDPERRFLMRCELDAAFFHLYGITRDDVNYIMDTFPIVRRKDEDAHGEYRTKRVILEMYDAMQHAIDTGVPYQTPVTPPPGEGPRHPQREEVK